MGGLLYKKELTCPLCQNEFNTTRVRQSKTVLDDKDSDFCPHYKTEENPIFYTPVICPRCGYGALKNNFEEINDEEKKVILDKISRNWKGADYGGRRDVQEATDCYQHVLKNAKAIERKASTLANITHRLGWCYRYQGRTREKKYLREAATYYKQAYEEEKLSSTNLNAVSLLYLIGELYRRLGDREKARKNFSKVIEHPKKHEHPRIEKLTRDQWQQTKDEN